MAVRQARKISDSLAEALHQRVLGDDVARELAQPRLEGGERLQVGDVVGGPAELLDLADP